jgi:hypothetical protein
MPYDFDLDGYVMLPLPDKLFHKVHDYNADTLLVERNLRIISCFSISLNVDNELDKPEIFFSFVITFKCTFRRIISINTQPVHITTSSNFRLPYYRNIIFSVTSITQAPQPVQAFKSIERLK